MLTAAQIRMRQTGLTATDMASISGENPFGSPAKVYDDKTCPIAVLLDRSQRPTNESESGNVFESALARRYAMAAKPEPAKVLRVVQSRGKTYRHPTCEWALATPDRFVFCLDANASRLCVSNADLRRWLGTKDPAPERAHRWLLECKLVGPRMMREWDTSLDADEDADRVPSYVYVQVQWQMFVLDQPRCDVAALLGGTTFRHFRIDRDQPYIDALVKLGGAFWHDHVLARVPPPPDGSDSYDRLQARLFPEIPQPPAPPPAGVAEQAYQRMMRRLFPQRFDNLVAAPVGAEAVALQYRQAGRAAAEAKKQQRICLQTLKQIVAEAPGIRADRFQAAWSSARGNIDVYALIREHGLTDEQVEKHRRPSRRDLRVTVYGADGVAEGERTDDEEVF